MLPNLSAMGFLAIYTYYVFTNSPLPEAIRNQTCCPTTHWGPNNTCCDQNPFGNNYYDKNGDCASDYNGITNIADTILALRCLLAITVASIMFIPWSRELHPNRRDKPMHPFSAGTTCLGIAAFFTLWLTSNILIWHSINLPDDLCRNPSISPFRLLHTTGGVALEFVVGVTLASVIPALIAIFIVATAAHCCIDAWCGPFPSAAENTPLLESGTTGATPPRYCQKQTPPPALSPTPSPPSTPPPPPSTPPPPPTTPIN